MAHEFLTTFSWKGTGEVLKQTNEVFDNQRSYVLQGTLLNTVTEVL